MRIIKLNKKYNSDVLSLIHEVLDVAVAPYYTKGELNILHDMYSGNIKHTNAYVLLDNKEVVGMISFSPSGKIDDLIVKRQGKGYGTMLYKFAEKELMKKKVSKITLNASLNSVKFYEKMGFSKVSGIERTSYGVRIIKMEKALS